MGKRKQSERKNKKLEEESSSDEDVDLVDVDFEFFDPQPEHDFHGLKTLLRQLLDVDAQSIDLSALADLILVQPLLGSTVKVDGNKSDPYAFLTILNLRQHQEQPVVKSILDYLRSCSAKSADLEQVVELLKPDGNAEVGLVLTDRLLNMPSEVVPPMYKMLLEEISWAVEEKEPYTFTHYLVLSKTYCETESHLDQDDDRPKKKKKHLAKIASHEAFFFHPEDEVLQRHALAHGSFPYLRDGSSGDADSKRAFQEMGVKPQGHMILIEAAQFEEAIKAIDEYLRVS